MTQSLHSICRWTFCAGKGGFVPSNQRPDWATDSLSTAGVIGLIRGSIAPRVPNHVVLGFELHYDGELIQNAGYSRWKGHDVQTRPYDNTEQGIDRVVRSILSWKACEQAALALNTDQLLSHLANRDTAKAEDMMRHAVVAAQKHFDEMYG